MEESYRGSLFLNYVALSQVELARATLESFPKIFQRDLAQKLKLFKSSLQVSHTLGKTRGSWEWPVVVFTKQALQDIASDVFLALEEKELVWRSLSFIEDRQVVQFALAEFQEHFAAPQEMRAVAKLVREPELLLVFFLAEPERGRVLFKLLGRCPELRSVGWQSLKAGIGSNTFHSALSKLSTSLSSDSFCSIKTGLLDVVSSWACLMEVNGEESAGGVQNATSVAEQLNLGLQLTMNTEGEGVDVGLCLEILLRDWAHRPDVIDLVLSQPKLLGLRKQQEHFLSKSFRSFYRSAAAIRDQFGSINKSRFVEDVLIAFEHPVEDQALAAVLVCLAWDLLPDHADEVVRLSSALLTPKQEVAPWRGVNERPSPFQERVICQAMVVTSIGVLASWLVQGTGAPVPQLLSLLSSPNSLPWHVAKSPSLLEGIAKEEVLQLHDGHGLPEAFGRDWTILRLASAVLCTHQTFLRISLENSISMDHYHVWSSSFSPRERVLFGEAVFALGCAILCMRAHGFNTVHQVLKTFVDLVDNFLDTPVRDLRMSSLSDNFAVMPTSLERISVVAEHLRKKVWAVSMTLREIPEAASQVEESVVDFLLRYSPHSLVCICLEHGKYSAAQRIASEFHLGQGTQQFISLASNFAKCKTNPRPSLAQCAQALGLARLGEPVFQDALFVDLCLTNQELSSVAQNRGRAFLLNENSFEEAEQGETSFVWKASLEVCEELNVRAKQDQTSIDNVLTESSAVWFDSVHRGHLGTRASIERSESNKKIRAVRERENHKGLEDQLMRLVSQAPAPTVHYLDGLLQYIKEMTSLKRSLNPEGEKLNQSERDRHGSDNLFQFHVSDIFAPLVHSDGVACKQVAERWYLDFNRLVAASYERTLKDIEIHGRDVKVFRSLLDRMRHIDDPCRFKPMWMEDNVGPLYALACFQLAATSRDPSNSGGDTYGGDDRRKITGGSPIQRLLSVCTLSFERDTKQPTTLSNSPREQLRQPGEQLHAVEVHAECSVNSTTPAIIAVTRLRKGGISNEQEEIVGTSSATLEATETKREPSNLERPESTMWDSPALLITPGEFERALWPVEQSSPKENLPQTYKRAFTVSSSARFANMNEIDRKLFLRRLAENDTEKEELKGLKFVESWHRIAKWHRRKKKM